uniref:Uncharacterized protein n=1 Tax=Glossina austeni TaxID=7395 RepID=A0A1A9UDZ6_GLOAU
MAETYAKFVDVLEIYSRTLVSPTYHHKVYPGRSLQCGTAHEMARRNSIAVLRKSFVRLSFEAFLKFVCLSPHISSNHSYRSTKIKIKFTYPSVPYMIIAMYAHTYVMPALTLAE